MYVVCKILLKIYFCQINIIKFLSNNARIDSDSMPSDLPSIDTIWLVSTKINDKWISYPYLAHSIHTHRALVKTKKFCPDNFSSYIVLEMDYKYFKRCVI